MYKNFFTDDEQTKLTNDQFGKLSDLEKLLKKWKTSIMMQLRKIW